MVYDTAAGTWSMYFDGSDVGLGGTDINAFHVFAGNGAIAFSIDSATYNLPGMGFNPDGGDFTRNDIIYFFPSSTGATTSGIFFFLIDGSDVGLDGSDENIDGLHVSDFGEFLLSTSGSASVPGSGGIQDEDVLFFLPSAFFSNSAGSFFHAFDGSDVGLSDPAEDINGLYFDTLDLSLWFSTIGTYAAGGSRRQRRRHRPIRGFLRSEHGRDAVGAIRHVHARDPRVLRGQRLQFSPQLTIRPLRAERSERSLVRCPADPLDARNCLESLATTRGPRGCG